MSAERPGTGPSPGDDRPGRVPRVFGWFAGHQRPGAIWLLTVPAVVVLSVAVAAGLAMMPGSGRAGPQRQVVAVVPFWNLGHGTAAVLSHRRDVTEVSLWMYGLTRDGRITPQYPQQQATQVGKQMARLRAAGMPIVPTLANMTGGAWSYPPVAHILHNPARMRAHVRAITQLVRQRGYAGIDLDYENLRAGDRQAFSGFVTALGTALHADGKLLSVAVFAKTTPAGYDQRNQAQDYAAIGRAADEVRIMAYDYHWASSGPGPVSPVGWVRDVVRYARSTIPAGKVILGIPLYGYDWSGGRGKPVSWLQALQLSKAHQSAAHYDATAQSPWFRYTEGGRQHVVWFESGASTRAKIRVARAAGLGGVFLWMYGPEDPGTWPALASVFPAGSATAAAAGPARTPGDSAP